MKLIGIARVGKEPVTRNTSTGKPVMYLSVAYDYGKPDANRKRKTQWIDCAWFGEYAAQTTIPKGALIYAEINEAHIEEYSRNDGSKGTKMSGMIDRLRVIRTAAASSDAPQPAPSQAARGGFDDMDDDIPF